jgi:hypothetical protein
MKMKEGDFGEGNADKFFTNCDDGGRFSEI